MSEQTKQEILNLLKDKIINHQTHDVIPRDSLSASKIRGTKHEEATKAIILEDSKGYFQVILEAHKKINMKVLKKLREVKNCSLAHPDKVQELTDCVVGSVPPFGILWNIPVYADTQLQGLDETIFSAGTLTDTMRIKVKDLLEINKAKVYDLSKE
jgi:Ala-tRNA(Pro) deacylase